MPNPYAQVAWTYIRRFRSLGASWAVIGFIPLLWLGMVAFFVWRPVDTVSMFLLFGAMFPIMALVFHVKDQFLDASSHLMPNYRRVHATVAVAAVLSFTVLFPLVLSLLAGLNSLGLAACFAVMFSMFLWACLGKGGWTVIGVALIVISSYFDCVLVLI